MDKLKRIENQKNYYKSNFTSEEQQMHLNFTIDAIKQLLNQYETRFIAGNDRDLTNLAMIEDFQYFLENINLKK